MTRLIIGAGHVGRALIRRWVSAGEVPYATARSPERLGELAALGARPVLCDVTRPETLTDLPEVDVAVWCVGHDRSATADIREVYVNGLARVLARLRCERLVYTSSTGVYGLAVEEVDESTPPAPEDPGGRASLAGEELLRAARPDAIVLRLAGLYGGDRIVGLKMIASGGELDGDPKRWINFLHHDDAALALDLAASKAAPGALYNVVDDWPLTRRQYYDYLADLLEKPHPEFRDYDARSRGRRVLARRIRSELGFQPRFRSVFEGVAHRI